MWRSPLSCSRSQLEVVQRLRPSPELHDRGLRRREGCSSIWDSRHEVRRQPGSAPHRRLGTAIQDLFCGDGRRWAVLTGRPGFCLRSGCSTLYLALSRGFHVQARVRTEAVELSSKSQGMSNLQLSDHIATPNLADPPRALTPVRCSALRCVHDGGKVYIVQSYHPI